MCHRYSFLSTCHGAEVEHLGAFLDCFRLTSIVVRREEATDPSSVFVCAPHRTDPLRCRRAVEDIGGIVPRYPCTSCRGALWRFIDSTDRMFGEDSRNDTPTVDLHHVLVRPAIRPRAIFETRPLTTVESNKCPSQCRPRGREQPVFGQAFTSHG